MRPDAITPKQRAVTAGAATPILGLSANWRQFVLLLATNAFVGGMVGMERSVLPALARDEFGIASKTVAVSFIAAFGLAKATSNLVAGRLSERFSRRSILIAGWVVGAPVPLLIIVAPSWSWIVAANVLLGINQGLAWSMTVNMKIDLVGPRRRGLALGLNESAGYLSVAAAAFATGIIASAYGLRPEPWYLGIALAGAGLAFSVLFIRDTAAHVRTESEQLLAVNEHRPAQPSLAGSFARGTWRDRHLVGISQSGFVNNLNDGLAWGVLPLFFASRGQSLDRIAVLAAIYPLVWGGLQIATGWASDWIGRKPLIVTGMVCQAIALSMIGWSDSFARWLAALVVLGAGTAMVYPTLLAATGDAVAPSDRATAIGVYRFWRDGGAVAGALIAGALADVFSFNFAIQVVAGMTVASAIIAAGTLRDPPRSAEEPTHEDHPVRS